MGLEKTRVFAYAKEYLVREDPDTVTVSKFKEVLITRYPNHNIDYRKTARILQRLGYSRESSGIYDRPPKTISV